MAFEERFRLLIESGQASEQTVAATRTALETVEAHYRIRLIEEVGASLATHIAVTMKRLLDGEAVTQAPDAVWQELAAWPEEVELAASIVHGLSRSLNRSIARDEVGFIALHLCRIKAASRPAAQHPSAAGTSSEASA
jgi:transcriptional regulatory protein LevR